MPKRRGRKKGRLYPQLQKKIFDTVKKYPGASTHEIATRARVGWATSDKYLKELRRENKVKSRKRGVKTIWIR